MKQAKFRTSGAAAPVISSIHWLATFGLLGCQASPPKATSGVYHLRGTVTSIDKPKQQITVNGKEIPGLMPAMTMPYPVAVEDGAALGQVAGGDEIAAEVDVDDKGFRLRGITVVKKDDANSAARATAAPATPKKDAVPDFALLNQDGKQIHLRDYRGQTLLLNFIYTRCPLPGECPLATHNFATIEKTLAKNPALYAKTHLLSISFDPEYDTPAVLRNYARGYGQDRFNHWEFAALLADQIRVAAGFFDLLINEEQGQISHSMCAAIISPEGTLYRLYPGDEWKPNALLADVSTLADKPAAARNAADRPSAAPNDVAVLR